MYKSIGFTSKLAFNKSTHPINYSSWSGQQSVVEFGVMR